MYLINAGTENASLFAFPETPRPYFSDRITNKKQHILSLLPHVEMDLSNNHIPIVGEFSPFKQQCSKTGAIICLTWYVNFQIQYYLPVR